MFIALTSSDEDDCGSPGRSLSRDEEDGDGRRLRMAPGADDDSVVDEDAASEGQAKRRTDAAPKISFSSRGFNRLQDACLRCGSAHAGLANKKIRPPWSNPSCTKIEASRAPACLRTLNDSRNIF
jgi:hypothetical protein